MPQSKSIKMGLKLNFALPIIVDIKRNIEIPNSQLLIVSPPFASGIINRIAPDRAIPGITGFSQLITVCVIPNSCNRPLKRQKMLVLTKDGSVTPSVAIKLPNMLYPVVRVEAVVAYPPTVAAFNARSPGVIMLSAIKLDTWLELNHSCCEMKILPMKAGRTGAPPKARSPVRKKLIKSER